MNDLFQDPNKNSPDYQTYIQPGGKFYDQDPAVMAEKIAKSKWDSDNYIKTIEAQKDEMREELLRSKEEYNKRAKLEELIDQLSQRQEQNHNTPEVKDVKLPEFDAKRIEDLVSNKLQAMTKAQKEDENFNFVQQRLTERYGSNYQNVLKEHMTSLDLDASTVNEMARNKPNTLLKILRTTEAPKSDPFSAPPRNNVQSFRPGAPKEETWTYFQEMKKNDPKAYFSKSNQLRMHDAAVKLGDAFMDGDFKAYGQ